MKLHFARRHRGCRTADYTNCRHASGIRNRRLQTCDVERYPLRRTPAHTMFARLRKLLCDSGSFHKATRNRNRTTRIPANEETVLCLAEGTLSRSTRGMKSGFYEITCGGFRIATICIHITYRTSSYRKNVTFHYVWLFSIGICGNELYISVYHFPYCSQMRHISRERLFSVLMTTMLGLGLTHLRYVLGLHRHVLW